jgi:hypothetical protein
LVFLQEILWEGTEEGKVAEDREDQAEEKEGKAEVRRGGRMGLNRTGREKEAGERLNYLEI